MRAPQFNSQIYSEAADWLVEFRSGDADASARAAFYQWLRVSPEHMRAYLELAAIWNEGAGMDPKRQFDDGRLIEEYRKELSIVPLHAGATDRVSIRSPKYRRTILTVAASVICAVVGTSYWFLSDRDAFATDVGQQRLVTLRDGSSVQLNSNSRIRIRFVKEQRDVDLLRGQALFHVAKDSTRPFVVHAGDTDVRAVGTQFDVYRRNDVLTTVTVVEGRVAVLHGDSGPDLSDHARSDTLSLSGIASSEVRHETNALAGGGGVLLTAGQQIVVSKGQAQQASQTDVPAATAWTRHQLIFKGAPLKDVVEEFNRYNSRQLHVVDEDLADLKITGIFSSTNPSALITFLESRPDVQLSQTEDDIRVSRKR